MGRNNNNNNSNSAKDGKCSNTNASSRGNRNNHRNKNRGNNKFDSKEKGIKYTNGDVNNPAYYYEDPTVLSQVMNFSFNEFGGVPINIDRDQWGNKVNTTNVMVASYWLNPSIPQTSNPDIYVMDGATTASLRNYLALSGSNAKTTVYAPQDVTILTLAIAELIKASTWIARAFGVAYLFNYRNRSYPETLLYAMGIDAAEFARNLATYRVRYNKLLAMASKIPFPADIPLFKKAADLYAYIYLDDPNSALAQTYMLNPASVWKYDEEYNENGAGLVTSDLANTLGTETFGDVLDRFEAMISALINSTGLNAIYSDIMRLVQNGKITNLITFKPIDEMFTVVPVYNDEVRDWLHNAIVMGYPLATAGQYTTGSMEPLTNKNDVICDANTNKLIYHPQFLVPHAAWGFEALIDFTHDNPTVEEKVRATRFSQRFTSVVDSSETPIKIYTDNLAFNDEYIARVDFYDGMGDSANMYINYTYDKFNDVEKRRIVQINTTLSKFDWAPLFYWLDPDNQACFIEGDLDYYTTIDFDTLKKIYDYEIIHLLQIG